MTLCDMKFCFNLFQMNANQFSISRTSFRFDCSCCCCYYGIVYSSALPLAFILFILLFRRGIYINFQSALTSSIPSHARVQWIGAIAVVILVFHLLPLGRRQLFQFFGLISVKNNRSRILVNTAILSAARRSNAYLKNIIVPSGELCNGNSSNVVGLEFQNNDACMSNMLTLCCGNEPNTYRIQANKRYAWKSMWTDWLFILYTYKRRFSVLPWQIQCFLLRCLYVAVWPIAWYHLLYFRKYSWKSK